MRLFVGVELGDIVGAAAADAAGRLRDRLSEAGAEVTARWIAPENLHITLSFLGEVKDDRASAVTSVLESPFETPAFQPSVTGCGAFPASGAPRVFWLGVTAGAESMVRIYGELEDRLVPFGFKVEKRPYAPHVTVARVKEIRRAAARRAREALAAVPADCGSCRIHAITLFRSRLTSKGLQYEPLLRVPLS